MSSFCGRAPKATSPVSALPSDFPIASGGPLQVVQAQGEPPPRTRSGARASQLVRASRLSPEWSLQTNTRRQNAGLSTLRFPVPSRLSTYPRDRKNPSRALRTTTGKRRMTRPSRMYMMGSCPPPFGHRSGRKTPRLSERCAHPRRHCTRWARPPVSSASRHQSVFCSQGKHTRKPAWRRLDRRMTTAL